MTENLFNKNPYPEFITDESSDIQVLNEKSIIWQNGFSAGFDDCLDAFNKNLKMMENLMDHGATPEQIIDRLVEATNAVKT